MNMDTVLQAMGSWRKLRGTGSGVEESELPHWFEVFSECLPTFDVFVHTYSRCVLLLERESGVERRGGARWKKAALGLHVEMWGRVQRRQADN